MEEWRINIGVLVRGFFYVSCFSICWSSHALGAVDQVCQCPLKRVYLCTYYTCRRSRGRARREINWPTSNHDFFMCPGTIEVAAERREGAREGGVKADTPLPSIPMGRFPFAYLSGSHSLTLSASSETSD